jgi:hypothetical protein
LVRLGPGIPESGDGHVDIDIDVDVDVDVDVVFDGDVNVDLDVPRVDAPAVFEATRGTRQRGL